VLRLLAHQCADAAAHMQRVATHAGPGFELRDEAVRTLGATAEQLLELTATLHARMSDEKAQVKFRRPSATVDALAKAFADKHFTPVESLMPLPALLQSDWSEVAADSPSTAAGPSTAPSKKTTGRRHVEAAEVRALARKKAQAALVQTRHRLLELEQWAEQRPVDGLNSHVAYLQQRAAPTFEHVQRLAADDRASIEPEDRVPLGFDEVERIVMQAPRALQRGIQSIEQAMAALGRAAADMADSPADAQEKASVADRAAALRSEWQEALELLKARHASLLSDAEQAVRRHTVSVFLQRPDAEGFSALEQRGWIVTVRAEGPPRRLPDVTARGFTKPQPDWLQVYLIDVPSDQARWVAGQVPASDGLLEDTLRQTHSVELHLHRDGTDQHAQWTVCHFKNVVEGWQGREGLHRGTVEGRAAQDLLQRIDELAAPLPAEAS
jgi:hypothetical protein